MPRRDLRVGEMEVLPYVDASFYAVTGFNGSASPRNALAEAHHVLRPGGTIVIATWDRRRIARSLTTFGRWAA